MADTWVELRVHGVSGTPPDAMLDRPHVRQVDGDSRSRFFRAVGADGQLLVEPDGHAVEGFHWGRYTSGSWRQSFFLALLPFGLVNMAAFMLPAPHRPDGVMIRGAGPARAVALAMVRLLALLLTIVFAFATTLVLVDVVAVRWVSRESALPDGVQYWAPTVAVLASGAAIGVLGGSGWIDGLLGRTRAADGLANSLRPTPPVGPSHRETSMPDTRRRLTPFASPDFYDGDPDAPTLRALHVAAGVLVPSAVVLGITRGLAHLPMILLLATALLVLVLGDDQEVTAPGMDRASTSPFARWHRVAGWLSRLLLVASGVVLAWAAWTARGFTVTTVVDPRTYQETRARIREFDDRAVDLLLLGGAVLLVTMLAIAVLAVICRSALPSAGTPAWHFRPYSGGLAAIAVIGIATSLAVGFSAAVVVGAETVLSQRGRHLGPLGRIDLLDGIAYAWGLTLVALVIVVAVVGVCRLGALRRLRPRAAAALVDDGSIPVRRLAAWRARLAAAMWVARFKNRIEALAWTFFGVGVVLGAAQAIAVAHGRSVLGPVGWLARQGAPPSLAAVLTQVGTWALLGIIAGLVIVARSAFRDVSTRRGINIVWDVVAFWPHAVHPFIPTPYSMCAVGDLAERVRGHCQLTEDHTVVVCGHSQGSLVTFAALNTLAEDELAGVGYLTFGSQLRVIFPRAFPMYVNFDAISGLYAHLGGAWINLYRETDPLAGPVLSWHRTPEGTEPARSDHFPEPGLVRPDVVSGAYRTRRCGDDWRLLDPVPRVDRSQVAPIETIHGHSGFWAHPEWPVALTELRRRLRP